MVKGKRGNRCGQPELVTSGEMPCPGFEGQARGDAIDGKETLSTWLSTEEAAKMAAPAAAQVRAAVSGIGNDTLSLLFLAATKRLDDFGIPLEKYPDELEQEERLFQRVDRSWVDQLYHQLFAELNTNQLFAALVGLQEEMQAREFAGMR